MARVIVNRYLRIYVEKVRCKTEIHTDISQTFDAGVRITQNFDTKIFVSQISVIGIPSLLISIDPKNHND